MPPQGQFPDSASVQKLVSIGLGIFVAVLILFASTYIVEPGHRGIFVTMGKVAPGFAPEGFGFKQPFVTRVIPVSIRQQANTLRSDCYSSDLQQVAVELKVLYRVPEASVVRIYQEFAGDPFDTLIAPRVNEAIKEMTALQSAETIVKKREEIKSKSLEAARAKIGTMLVVEDIVIQNITLSKELENAIEAKMVQEQEAAKAKFTQQKAEIEASTAIIRAKGEAQAILIRGAALRQNPALVHLQIVEKWDGKTPMVVGGSGGGSNILLPLGSLKN